MKIHSVEEDVYILAIESSCDETAASVVKNGDFGLVRLKAPVMKQQLPL